MPIFLNPSKAVRVKRVECNTYIVLTLTLPIQITHISSFLVTRNLEL